MYPFKYIFMGMETILIWQTDDNQKDVFRITNELVAGNSVDELKKILGDESNLVEWLEGGEVDFDVFWKLVDSLKAGDASSTKTCTVLLDGWNFLEPVYDLRNNKVRKAKQTNCKLILSLRSQLFHNLRYFCNQAKERSTTQRLGITAKVCN